MSQLLFFIIVCFIIWFLFFRKKRPISEQISQQPKLWQVSVKSPILLRFSLFLLILAFNIFIYQTSDGYSIPGIGFAGFNLTFLLVVLFSLAAKKRTSIIYSIALISAISSLCLIFRANGFVQSFNIAVMMILNCLLIFIHFQEKIFLTAQWLIKQIIKLIPAFFKELGLLFNRQPTSIKDTVNKQPRIKIFSIFKTVTITLIILVFFIGLLSAADPIFAEIIKDFQEEIIGRTIASLIVAFIATLILILQIKADEEDHWRLGFFSFNDLFIPVASLIALFAVFIVVQINYLFASHADLQAYDLTYSEYVRKGFTELLATAFFGSLIAYLVIIKKRLLKTVMKIKELQLINIILIVELFFMLASALKRDLMYVEVYGLTRVRIIGALFLFWLTVLLLLLLILTLFKQIKEKFLFIGGALTSLFVCLAINILNVDQIIINSSPEHHDYKDYFYINNLSEDGVDGWLESIPQLGKELDLLLAKAELTDVEKSRLAGDKLALISLQEKRAKLYRKYASEEWLLNYFYQHQCAIDPFLYGLDREYISDNDINANKEMLNYNYQNTCLDANYQYVLSDTLKEDRRWQHWHWVEQSAFNQLDSQRELIFDQVDQLLIKIRSYQINHDLSLFKEETRLLRDFKYPFININLSYDGEELSSYRIKDSLNIDFTQQQLDLMSDNSYSVSDLAQARCPDLAEENIVMIGVIKRVERPDINNFFYFSDENTKPGSELNLYAADFLNSSLRADLNSHQDAIAFGRVVIKVSQDNRLDPCLYRFEIIEWQELKKLSE